MKIPPCSWRAFFTPVFPPSPVPQSATQRHLRASPARARQTVQRATASSSPAPAGVKTGNDKGDDVATMRFMDKGLKKLLTWLLCLVLCAGAVACTGEKSASGQKSPSSITQQGKRL